MSDPWMGFVIVHLEKSRGPCVVKLIPEPKMSVTLHLNSIQSSIELSQWIPTLGWGSFSKPIVLQPASSWPQCHSRTLEASSEEAKTSALFIQTWIRNFSQPFGAFGKNIIKNGQTNSTNKVRVWVCLLRVWPHFEMVNRIKDYQS